MSQATAEIRVRVVRLQWPYWLSALNLRASEKLNKPAASDKQVARFLRLDVIGVLGRRMWRIAG